MNKQVKIQRRWSFVKPRLTMRRYMLEALALLLLIFWLLSLTFFYREPQTEVSREQRGGTGRLSLSEKTAALLNMRDPAAVVYGAGKRGYQGEMPDKKIALASLRPSAEFTLPRPNIQGFERLKETEIVPDADWSPLFAEPQIQPASGAAAAVLDRNSVKCGEFDVSSMPHRSGTLNIRLDISGNMRNCWLLNSSGSRLIDKSAADFILKNGREAGTYTVLLPGVEEDAETAVREK